VKSEHSTVQWGTTPIPYRIVRSARRRTVSLTIEARDGLIVTAPETAPIAKLDAIVKAKATWVVSRMRLRDELPPALTSREFVSGESFLYLGRQYRLRLIPVPAPRPVALRGGWLEVAVPKGRRRELQKDIVRAALIAWYKRLATERLPDWTQPFAAKLGASISEVRIAEQDKRWGSCSSSILRINWRIIQAPRTLIDYVLAHEVAHLIHEHHGRDFWATLGRILPDYEERRARLKLLGPTLLW